MKSVFKQSFSIMAIKKKTQQKSGNWQNFTGNVGLQGFRTAFDPFLKH